MLSQEMRREHRIPLEDHGEKQDKPTRGLGRREGIAGSEDGGKDV